MRDGINGIKFQSRQGAGMGLLILDNGRVYGTDMRVFDMTANIVR